ncbi:DevA family ABC transporter ATP-binding protein [Chroogloeocystis siderophila]|jgi:putative ABC transport system ATP-binding protein|uniref:ABC transporter n=1 Tax=Chroogloeocystis siderophila 5.2 s.c.1 TaxID=247279 RepID=A0A1U7HQF8_9CHRO|nr:DevA family ABC transporter ATP-binding protein [Chroogloeocystis siderophila]OKH25833.1 ABC transporter [Chroogloeocystis siderophila 5.2 s.c.1]
MQHPALKIQSLNHYYGKGVLQKQTLLNINLEIGAGEFVIITGQSGSGKTTLLSLIGGLRSVQSGSIQLLGQELAGASQQKLTKLRRQIGYIFQSHNLLGFLTAQQNVQMAAQVNNNISLQAARSQSQTILQAVGLGDRLNYYPENLSGGQKQRVAIARALVNQPKLVLADEPTASLDSKSGRAVVELMQHLAQEQSCTIVMVTHDNRILDVAERIIHMEDGRLSDDHRFTQNTQQLIHFDS